MEMKLTADTGWDTGKERSLRMWVRQMVCLSYLYMKASRTSKALSVISNVINTIGFVYTIPGYGCSLVSGEVCIMLNWTGIVLGVVVGFVSVMTFIYNPEDKARAYDFGAKGLLKLSRRIDSELTTAKTHRKDASQFSTEIITAYEEVVDNLRLPWFIGGEQQLANISLIQCYNELDEVVKGKDKDTPRMNVSSTDLAVMNRMNFELNRLTDPP